jgi:acyl carrier protein
MSVQDEIVRLVRQQLGNPAVRPEHRIIEDLGAESMDIVNIVAAVEERFGLAIDESALPEVHSVADLAALVERGGC